MNRSPKRQVAFCFGEPARAPSPLLPDDIEPVVVDTETYKIENFCAANQDPFFRLDRINTKMPQDGDGASSLTMLKKPALSRSMPTISFQKLELNKNFIRSEDAPFAKLGYMCAYDEKVHRQQVSFISQFPDIEKKETVMVQTAMKMIEFIPESETEIVAKLNEIVRNNDSLQLVSIQEDLFALYTKYIDDADSDDALFVHLEKLLIFVARFSVKSFSARDASFMATYSSSNVSTDLKNFFLQMGDVLNCDFADSSLVESLIEFLKYFNDRLVVSLRWILMNLCEGQIITLKEPKPSIVFTLSRPRAGSEDPAEEPILDFKKLLNQVADLAAHATQVLRRLDGSDVVNSWQGYFETTEACYKTIAADYSPTKMKQAGVLYAKSLAALTKFEPVCGKINTELPEIVSEVISAVSILDATIAHTRSGFILPDDLSNSLTEIVRKLRDLIMSVHEPTLSSHLGILFFDFVKIKTLIDKPGFDYSLLSTLVQFVQILAQFSPSSISSNITQISFQLANVDYSLTKIQKAFIAAEASLMSLSRALVRSSKKLREPQQKQYAMQWASYSNSLANCIHSLLNEPRPSKQVLEVINVLQPIQLRAANMSIINEANSALTCLHALFELIQIPVQPKK